MGTRQSLHRRTGGPSVAEQNLVTALVLDSPTEVKPSQVTALAKALRRSPAAIKGMIEKAQESFRSKAQRYVDVHMEATELALAGGTVAGLEVAQKGAQWALELSTAEPEAEPSSVVYPARTGVTVISHSIVILKRLT